MYGIYTEEQKSAGPLTSKHLNLKGKESHSQLSRTVTSLCGAVKYSSNARSRRVSQVSHYSHKRAPSAEAAQRPDGL